MKNSFKKTESGWRYLEYSPVEISKSSPDFLIFHGYGAGAGDLVFLQTLYPKARWFFPNAFLNKKDIPSWFYGDTEEYIQHLQNNELMENVPPSHPNGDIGKLIEELPIQSENLILGGFSQGAFLSAFLTLEHFIPRALILLSGGMLLEKKVSQKKASASMSRPFFQSHGRFDDILPLVSGDNLFHILTDRGWQGDFHSFDGGHEVPPEILKKLKDWLIRLF